MHRPLSKDDAPGKIIQHWLSSSSSTPHHHGGGGEEGGAEEPKEEVVGKRRLVCGIKLFFDEVLRNQEEAMVYYR